MVAPGPHRFEPYLSDVRQRVASVEADVLAQSLRRDVRFAEEPFESLEVGRLKIAQNCVRLERALKLNQVVLERDEADKGGFQEASGQVVCALLPPLPFEQHLFEGTDENGELL